MDAAVKKYGRSGDADAVPADLFLGAPSKAPLHPSGAASRNCLHADDQADDTDARREFRNDRARRHPSPPPDQRRCADTGAGAGRQFGKEIGVRSEIVPGLQRSLALWKLDSASELPVCSRFRRRRESRSSR